MNIGDCIGRINKRAISQIQVISRVFSLLLKLDFLMPKVTLHLKQFKMCEFALCICSVVCDGVIPNSSSGQQKSTLHGCFV